jgi:ABC-2 type transport system permease protein
MSSFKDDISSDMRHIYLNVLFELKKHWNKKRIIIVSFLAVLLSLVFYAVPPLLGGDYSDTANGFASSNLHFISLLIIISAAMYAGDAISSEFENRTGLILFPTPQRQNSIFVGKYIASLLATWLAVMLYYLVTLIAIGQIYGLDQVSMEFGQSFLLALLYSASAVSLIYFFSAVMKRAITSTLIGFFALLMILPIISLVLTLGSVDPWFIITHSADLITDVLGTAGSSFRPGSTSDGGPMSGLADFSPDFYVGIGVMVAYAIGFFIVGLGIANRKKMEG